MAVSPVVSINLSKCVLHLDRVHWLQILQEKKHNIQFSGGILEHYKFYQCHVKYITLETKKDEAIHSLWFQDNNKNTRKKIMFKINNKKSVSIVDFE